MPPRGGVNRRFKTLRDVINKLEIKLVFIFQAQSHIMVHLYAPNNLG
jgi:hypothetical protein